MAVTLLRCFHRAHPGAESYGGQQPGISKYHFGLLPMVAADTDAHLQRTQDVLATGIQYRVDSTAVEKPEEHSYVCLDAEHTVYSTMKVSEDRQGIVLRLYNISGETDTARLTFDRPIGSAALVNLEEQHPAALPTDGNALTLEMAPYAIRTVYLTF